MLAVVAAVVLAIVHIHFAPFNNCNSPNSACTLGPCTWFLLDIGLRARISRRGLVAYIDLPIDLPITSRFVL